MKINLWSDKFSKPYLPIIVLLLVLVPTFWTLIKPGIFSMQDPHVFRLYEFDKCIRDLQIPCRWAPDSAFEYGEPMFNFYGQLSYLLGEPFILVGFSIIDTLKVLFALSLVLSALTMFLLAKQIWGGNWGAILAAAVYTYAPYRAVDIYVRGALPESTAFIFFPLITLLFNKYTKDRKITTLLLFSLSFAGLLLTHNLSAFMYSIFLFFWGTFILFREKTWNLIPKFLISIALIFGLTSFYVLPVVFESHYITIEKTTQGFFDFRAHFVTLNQLLFSRYFGYGASLWGEDDRLSLSVGQVQWALPLFLAILALVFRKKAKSLAKFACLFLLGWLMLLLTHNKSTLIWTSIPIFAYIQFPWRFLGLAVFSFALSTGFITQLLTDNFQKILVTLTIILAFALNTGFFHEDLWFNITDREQFIGSRYEQLSASSINDFWPNWGTKTPTQFSKGPVFVEGFGQASLIEKSSKKADFQVIVQTGPAAVQFPIVYFPGWEAKVDGMVAPIKPSGELGAITLTLNQGGHLIELEFKDTQIRRLGNLISLSTLLLLVLVFISNRVKKK